MSKLLKGLVVSVMLSAGAAFAAPASADCATHVSPDRLVPPPPGVQVAPPRYPPPGIQSRERAERFEHVAYRGHYETRQVRHWVPGHWVTTMVPDCRVGVGCQNRVSRHFEHGHFEFVARTVWVNGPLYG